MIHPIRAWNRFFFATTSARPLGAIRIAFGLLALANLGLCAVDLDLWYSDAGYLRGDEARAIAGPFIFSPLQYIQSPTAARVTFGIAGATALGLTVGWRTRLMGILFYGAMLSIHARNTISSSGADVLLMVFAFNLMISPCGAAYSVDSWLARRRRGTAAEPVILAWSLRLVQIQISMVYALAAILKCGGVLWLNGSALHFVLHNSEVRRVDLTFIEQWPGYPILICLATYSALVMEFSLAFFIWFRAARPFVLYLGFMLHLGILTTINIPIFGELMWAGYLAFLTPPEFAAFARAVDVRRLFRRAATAVTEAPIAPAESPRPAEGEIDAQAAPAAPGRSLTIRIDPPAASPVPTPHRPAVAAHPKLQSAEEFAAEAMDPWDSFQILM